VYRVTANLNPPKTAIMLPSHRIASRFSGVLLLATTTLLTSLPAADQPVRAASTGGKSPHETTSLAIGGRGGPRVTITYGRPYAKDPKTGEPRKIWGALVPWDKAWRLGSDEATLLLTQAPLVIGDTTIPAGAYTLYMVPSENGPAKLAFSTNLGKWGVPVDETRDLARVDLTKDAVEPAVEQLTLSVENDPAGGGVLKIVWENTRYSLHFTVKS
jgi:Protein of unknown function (DUF2911)